MKKEIRKQKLEAVKDQDLEQVNGGTIQYTYSQLASKSVQDVQVTQNIQAGKVLTPVGSPVQAPS